MIPHLPAAVLLLAVATSAPEVTTAGAPALVDLAVARRGADYVAGCRLVNGLSPSMLDEIEAGIETTLDYRLQLYRRRPGLPDEPLVKRLVQVGVRHDTLARQYTLTRRLDGELVETKMTARPEEMRAFLTTLEGIPLAPATQLGDGTEFYLRARGDLGLVWRFYLIPWRLNTDWARVEVTRSVTPPDTDVAGQPPH